MATTIRNANELAHFIQAGKLFPVVSSVDSFAVYFQDGNKIREICGKENDNVPGEYMIHGEEKKSELLHNIEEFNSGMERASIVMEELIPIMEKVGYPITI